MARITEEDVRHVALLSRLYFSDEEIKGFTRDLNNILAYVEQLTELETSGVEPTSHALKMSNVFRADEVVAPPSVEDMLSNAPESESQCFKVPKIIQ
jgi:aspartyl-tRNA(Asn)/glutamyl-tRNA(Gln) amidotransferase subunit C